jgi:hypothetical protein
MHHNAAAKQHLHSADTHENTANENAQANYITIKSGRESLDAPKCYDSITENK